MTSNGDEGSEMTLTVLGCGTMGIAILSGILSSLSSSSSSSSPSSPNKSTSTSSPSETPSRLPSRFIACVRSPTRAAQIQTALSPHLNLITIMQNENVDACTRADIVLLACKPYMVSSILRAEGMRSALRSKLLISICAGVTKDAILDSLSLSPGSEEVTVVRAMPNTASQIRESMTVIATSAPPLPSETEALVTWIFKRIGDVVYLPASNMDASTALCGSGPAFFALVLEAAIDGAVAMGLPRAEAQRMGGADDEGRGGHPAILRDKVTTPGGCTIGGLLVLEEGMVRGTVAKAIREATGVAALLGKGVQGVNGTRRLE
ncbi:Pyrroline-5-carboxylate reductase [Lachnellula arida]|uniref:Pyrroline-5-carboxylate reductase n=1 Tax=Lachnellula arida TaxID=1316785 RepID=A0A8T9B0F2_9HELO|nr:Pyrroline-5-carboxylate reductase [Lachnellula arida]